MQLSRRSVVQNQDLPWGHPAGSHCSFVRKLSPQHRSLHSSLLQVTTGKKLLLQSRMPTSDEPASSQSSNNRDKYDVPHILTHAPPGEEEDEGLLQAEETERRVEQYIAGGLLSLAVLGSVAYCISTGQSPDVVLSKLWTLDPKQVACRLREQSHAARIIWPRS
jgi:hypothetical protein